jgi:hypothetical protein
MTEQQLTDEEAQQRIASMMLALDAIYQLHAPNTDNEPWTCSHCSSCDGDVEFPCQTETIILRALGIVSTEEVVNEETPTE